MSNNFYSKDQDPIKYFQQQYKAHVTHSSKYYEPPQPTDYIDWIMKGGDSLTYEESITRSPMVEITIPRKDFHHLIKRDQYLNRLERDLEYNRRVVDQMNMEEWIRKNNPAVQLAYEKYKMLLELAK